MHLVIEVTLKNEPLIYTTKKTTVLMFINHLVDIYLNQFCLL